MTTATKPERKMLDMATHKHTFTTDNWAKYIDDDETEYEGCDLYCVPCGFRYDVGELNIVVHGSCRYWYLNEPKEYHALPVHSEVIHPQEQYPMSQVYLPPEPDWDSPNEA